MCHASEEFVSSFCRQSFCFTSYSDVSEVILGERKICLLRVVLFIGSPVTSSADLQTPGGHYFMDLHHINKFEKGKKFLRVSLHCRAFGVPKS